jgi:hypothetical protein
MKDLPLDLGDHLAGMALIPAPVEVLGHGPKLDDEVFRQVRRLDFAALLSPQPNQGRLIVPMERGPEARVSCLVSYC